MTNQEAIELFEKAHTIKEQLDMQSDIDDIDRILTPPIYMYEVKDKIKSINDNHKENIILNRLIYPPVGNPVPLDYAPINGLIDDLSWKRCFLIAKKNAKAFDEFCKEMTNKG